MKNLIRFLAAFFAAFVLFSVVLFLDFWHFVHTPFNLPKTGYVFDFPSGTSVNQMADELAKAGLLKSPLRMLLWVRLSGAWHELKAGEYWVKPGSTAEDFINLLKSGKVIQHSLTIIPGWTFHRMMLEINQSPHLKHTLTGQTPEETMEKLGYQNEHPEGRFFPETYYFPKGTTDIAFLQRAHHALQQKLTALWEKRSDYFPLKSADEALILASIIEKESKWIPEYTEIAGVYIRRLAKKMPLQADPTVIYGMGPQFSGALTRQILSTPGPYNTYLKSGLPPTPIALPSQLALEAAFHPKNGDSLYFVVHPEGQSHVFSNNLKDHQNAVKQYRKSIAGKK